MFSEEFYLCFTRLVRIGFTILKNISQTPLFCPVIRWEKGRGWESGEAEEEDPILGVFIVLSIYLAFLLPKKKNFSKSSYSF